MGLASAFWGREVKSMRDGKAVLVDSYAVIEKGEAWRCGLDIGVHGIVAGRAAAPAALNGCLVRGTESHHLHGGLQRQVTGRSTDCNGEYAARHVTGVDRWIPATEVARS